MNLGIESETLEFKKSTGELKEAIHSICAILNKHHHGEITNLLLKSGREGNRWENLVSNKTIDDVDEELLKKYIIQAHDVGRIAISYTDKRTVLNQLELTEGDKLLNVGKALFSDDIIQDVQMAIFATSERLTFNDIQRHHGPVLKLVDIAESYIKNNIHWKVEFTGARQRLEIPEIPIDAIREALLNSFCHKDYSSGESNEVAIYKNRVEIYNPGTFPEGLEPQDFIDKAERPIRRNPKIARILYYSKDIESFGTGLKRIADACDEAGVRYEFQKKRTGFVVCFYRPEEKKPIKADKKPINDERKDRVLDYIKENGSISNKEARELLGLADSTTKRLLNELVKKEILKIEGEKKARRYFLL